MKNKWRLIIHPECEPSWNMAVDSALLQHLKEGEVTLRLYRWNKPAVSIGYFQDMDNEVNVALCRNDNVPIIRRVTGGGAVFHHEEITYCLIHPIEGVFSGISIPDSYKIISQPFVMALSSLGIDALYRPINDIIVGNKKISGSAQTRKATVLQQHGTMLVATNTDTMFQYLVVNPGAMQTSDKPVITIAELIDYESKEALYQKVIDAIVTAFSDVFNVSLHKSDMTEEEEETAKVFQQKYFLHDDWNKNKMPQQ